MRLLLNAITVSSLVAMSTVVLAQQPAPTANPLRMCVANFKTEIKQAADTIAMRDRLAVYLKSGALANDLKAEILTLKEDSDEKTAPEIATNKCDFAIYTRALVGKLPPPNVVNKGLYQPIGPRTSKTGETLVPGLQFTAVRVSSGMPVLIDRVFLDREYKTPEDMWLLLRAEQEKLDVGLRKRIAPSTASPQGN